MKKYLLLILASAIAISSGCASTDSFRFDIPALDKWDDIELQYISSSDNIKLAYREMGSTKCTKGFIFIPGSTMYGYYYVPFIKELSKSNILVRVVDIRGHGDSEGIRGDAPSENSLIEDLNLHIKDLKTKNSEMQIFIGGHSMGGGICGRYLEHYGYNSVKGVAYAAPIFHWRQSGIKNTGYVDVSILKTLFGGDHTISQIYHPGSDDPKLVKEYTNMLSRATMVSDYSEFRKNHTTDTLYIIGKEDELFDWQKSIEIFQDKKIKYLLPENTAHLKFNPDSLKALREWIISF